MQKKPTMDNNAFGNFSQANPNMSMNMNNNMGFPNTPQNVNIAPQNVSNVTAQFQNMNMDNNNNNNNIL